MNKSIGVQLMRGTMTHVEDLQRIMDYEALMKRRVVLTIDFGTLHTIANTLRGTPAYACTHA